MFAPRISFCAGSSELAFLKCGTCTKEKGKLQPHEFDKYEAGTGTKYSSDAQFIPLI